MKFEITTGCKYKTVGGWIAHIMTFDGDNPVGICKDCFGVEEPYIGKWDDKTGECIKRGDWIERDITKPYDILYPVKIRYRITFIESGIKHFYMNGSSWEHKDVAEHEIELLKIQDAKLERNRYDYKLDYVEIKL